MSLLSSLQTTHVSQVFDFEWVSRERQRALTLPSTTCLVLLAIFTQTASWNRRMSSINQSIFYEQQQHQPPLKPQVTKAPGFGFRCYGTMATTRRPRRAYKIGRCCGEYDFPEPPSLYRENWALDASTCCQKQKTRLRWCGGPVLTAISSIRVSIRWGVYVCVCVCWRWKGTLLKPPYPKVG